MTSRPGKRNWAKANAASDAIITWPIVRAMVTMTEFM